MFISKSDKRVLFKRISDLENKVSVLKNLLTTEDYFHDCPCCSTNKIIEKRDAVKFYKLSTGGWSGYPDGYYTTKESAEIHKTKIEQWEKEIEEYLKKK